jgi:YrbI family 3-deoxy-D-manno-octulosonate 8-phosphate phosphatase
MEREIGMAIAFIPVRGGSKSIPLKNIKLFCGKPLIYWNLQALANVDRVEKVIVATDSDEIESTVKSFGFKKVEVYRRDPTNATDSASTESVMLEYLSFNPVEEDELFILVQATSPLTKSNDFQQALDLLEREKCDSLLSCVRSKRFFWKEDGTPLNYDYQSRPRRQDFDGLLMENGAFYINMVKNILRDKNRLSGSIAIYEMPEYTSVEIDEEDDWIVAESLMRRHFSDYETIIPSTVKLFLSDVDGTLTDAGMYYDQNGNELKKFNTRDGKGFELLRNLGIKTGILTSENTSIVDRRAKKLKIDFLIQDVSNKGKLQVAMDLCKELDISLSSVAYIGDDVNCLELLESVGYAACPADAVPAIKNIPGIKVMKTSGGHGAVREFIEVLI